MSQQEMKRDKQIAFTLIGFSMCVIGATVRLMIREEFGR